METKHYRIKANFAKENDIPTSFIAVVVKETEKALYLYGHGMKDPTGRCARCGRILTHPGSIIIGIGPECLGDWGARDIILDNLSESDKQKMEEMIESRVVDNWMPKSRISEITPSALEVIIPIGHMMKNKFRNNENGTMAQVPQHAPVEEKSAKIVRLQSTGEQVIKIEFPYDMELVSAIKNIPGRKFRDDGINKYWTCPLSMEAVNILERFEFPFSQNLVDYKSNFNSVMEGNDLVVKGLKNELFPFQKKGLAFLEAMDGRALIGDEQGLGKTIQALAWLQLHPEERPAIVVCPASLKLNWQKEANAWMASPNTQVIVGTEHSIPLEGDILIINYDILSNKYETILDAKGKKHKKEIPMTGWVDYLLNIQPRVVILDECQYIKTRGNNRTKGTQKLSKKVPHLICLSGTPIENRPMEIFNTIQLINPQIFPNFMTFALKYCGARHNGFGWDFNGASNKLELHDILVNTLMIRRLKAEVLKELPPKIYSFVPMELWNADEYVRATADFIAWVRENVGYAAAEHASHAEQLVKIEVLKQLAVNGKMKSILEWISTFLESGEKLVVMAVHKNVINQIMEAFPNISVKIDGSTSMEERNKAVEAFQGDDKTQLFVGNIKAAGVGLTLTAASNVAFVELPWTPGALVQAEDRLHRIGQKGVVNVHYLLATHTIEEEIAHLLDRKKVVLGAILDGKEEEDVALLAELMLLYTGTEKEEVF